MPLFEGGLRTAEEDAAIAQYRLAVAQYRGTVLGAFQDVEDALSQIRILADEAAQEQLAVEACPAHHGDDDGALQGWCYELPGSGGRPRLRSCNPRRRQPACVRGVYRPTSI